MLYCMCPIDSMDQQVITLKKYICVCVCVCVYIYIYIKYIVPFNNWLLAKRRTEKTNINIWNVISSK